MMPRPPRCIMKTAANPFIWCWMLAFGNIFGRSFAYCGCLQDGDASLCKSHAPWAAYPAHSSRSVAGLVGSPPSRLCTCVRATAWGNRGAATLVHSYLYYILTLRFARLFGWTLVRCVDCRMRYWWISDFIWVWPFGCHQSWIRLAPCLL